MTHIVIACYASGSGGSVAAVAVRHACELAKYCERVMLVSNSFPKGLPKNVEQGRVTPMEFNFLRRLCHVPNEYAFVRSVRSYLEALHKRDRIDMIMCHSQALAALSAKPLKERYGIPFTLAPHGDIFDRPRGTYDSLLTAFYKAVTPVAYRSADLIIALSPYMASRAIKGGANSALVHVIPNGIDPKDIGLDISAVSSQQRPCEGALKLLYVGGLSVLKGVDVLIQACGMLKQRGVIFSLKLIGEGMLEKDLRNMVKEMDLSDVVSFAGKVSRSQLGAHYRRADLVCVPSLSDTLPSVVLEALISGTPVLGSDVGGIPFMVKEGLNGLLVPPKDHEALSDAIESLYQKPERLAQLKENARPSVLPRFSWEAIGKRIYALIEEKLASIPEFS
jgi:glycosyltransferase involved in cell wall biosynthesis